jgi:CheY-like chemotaxis protein
MGSRNESSISIHGLIVVADDDPIVHVVLRHYLQAASYRVAIANDGNEALDLARREKPRLIIMDVLMPRVDGLSALYRLKSCEETKQIPVLVLTSSAIRLTELEAIARGADGFLRKPFSKSQLLECLDQLLLASSEEHASV